MIKIYEKLPCRLKKPVAFIAAWTITIAAVVLMRLKKK